MGRRRLPVARDAAPIYTDGYTANTIDCVRADIRTDDRHGSLYVISQHRRLQVRILARAAAIGVAAVGVVPSWMRASAHHSTAMFDELVTKDLAGTVTRVTWANPHTYIFIMVKGDDGMLREWSIISGTPQLNTRNGWKRDDVKPGDKVIVSIHPARTGGPSGILRSIKLPDGRTLAGPREFLKVPDAN